MSYVRVRSRGVIDGESRTATLAANVAFVLHLNPSMVKWVSEGDGKEESIAHLVDGDLIYVMEPAATLAKRLAIAQEVQK